MAVAPHAVLAEAEARRVVLVQAIESVDERGRIVSATERERAEQDVLAGRMDTMGQPPDPALYLPARAAELLHTVEARNPALARLETRDPWWDRLGVVLPLLALAAGFASDRLFNSQRTDLLSPSLIGVAVWNLVVYAMLAVSALRRLGSGKGGDLTRTLHELPTWFSRRAAARLRDSAAARFRVLWWQVAGRLESARLHQVMHLAAAAWALGVVLSIVVTGVNTKFRVGWESTWFGAGQVHALLGAMSLPAQAIGFDAFTLQEVQRLEFGPASAPGQPEAQKWALVYIVFIVAVVGIPRLALWAWSRARARAFARKVALDLRGDYFANVMARVSPAQLVIGLKGADENLARCVTTILAQAGEPRDGGVLVTPRGDRLSLARDAAEADVVWDLPPGTGACWPLDGAIRDWLKARVPAAKHPGLERLLALWTRNHEHRWHAAMDRLARTLTESAADKEEVAGSWPGAKEREAANAQLITRLRERLDASHRDLLRLHLAQAGALVPGFSDAQEKAAWMQQGGAGAAGALAGALAGAKIDLITGGITLGAGMALGALLGGAGAFTAARTWLMGSTVRLSHEQLQALAESLIVQYLAVIHAGRALDGESAGIPPAWTSEAIAAVAARTDDFKRVDKLARAQDARAQPEMSSLMAACTWRVLQACYGPAVSASPPGA